MPGTYFSINENLISGNRESGRSCEFDRMLTGVHDLTCLGL